MTEDVSWGAGLNDGDAGPTPEIAEGVDIFAAADATARDFVLSLCAPQAERQDLYSPTFPKICRWIADSLAADAMIFGFEENRANCAVRWSGGDGRGRFVYGTAADLRERVAKCLAWMGQMLVERGNFEGAMWFMGVTKTGEDVKLKNALYVSYAQRLIDGERRFIDDVTSDTMHVLHRLSLFDDFRPGAGWKVIPLADGVWEVGSGGRGGGRLRPYDEGDRFLSWLPFGYGAGEEVNDLALRQLRALCGEENTDVYEDVLDGLAECLCLRKKEVALYFYGEAGGEGKTVTLKYLDRIFGRSGAITRGAHHRGNVLDDRKFLFGKGEGHLSDAAAWIHCSLMQVPDLASIPFVNDGNLVSVVAGSVLPTREMGKSVATSGMKIRPWATLVLQGNSLLGMDKMDSRVHVERRILGIVCQAIPVSLLEESFAAGEMEDGGQTFDAAARGLLRELLVRVKEKTWRGREKTWELWQEELLDKTDGGQDSFSSLGFTRGGDDDVVWLTGMYDAGGAKLLGLSQQTIGKLLRAKGIKIEKPPTQCPDRLRGINGSARINWVRGWTTSWPAGQMPEEIRLYLKELGKL